MLDNLGGMAGFTERGKLLIWDTGTVVLIIFPPRLVSQSFLEGRGSKSYRKLSELFCG